MVRYNYNQPSVWEARHSKTGNKTVGVNLRLDGVILSQHRWYQRTLNEIFTKNGKNWPRFLDVESTSEELLLRKLFPFAVQKGFVFIRVHLAVPDRSDRHPGLLQEVGAASADDLVLCESATATSNSGKGSVEGLKKSSSNDLACPSKTGPKGSAGPSKTGPKGSSGPSKNIYLNLWRVIVEGRAVEGTGGRGPGGRGRLK